MGRVNTALFAFNRGIVSKNSLSRVDVERVRLSAEIMENWTPKTQGSMFFRPGTEYLGDSHSDNEPTDIEFVFSASDTGVVELTNLAMRVYTNGAFVSRAARSTAVQNGDFAAATGWTDNSTNSGSTTISSDQLTLQSDGKGAVASIYQQVTVSGGDISQAHALDIEIDRGPVVLRLGSSQGADDYMEETVLRTGFHSLEITPSGDFYIQFSSEYGVDRIVKSCEVASSGDMVVTAPWTTAQLANLQHEQSGDVIFCACEGVQQYRIERRAGNSWSVVKYMSNNGPFGTGRTADVKLKVGATYGNTTMTADKDFFKAGHVGALFRIYHEGIERTEILGDEDQHTTPIQVIGINGSGYNDREWHYEITGTWSGIINIQRSFDDEEYGYATYGSNITANVGKTSSTDTDDNAITWYRLGFRAGNYTSGSATVTITYTGDREWGVGRITAVNSGTSADIEVLSPFSSTEFSTDWEEGLWSDKAGWPTGVAFHSGRLWWGGKTRVIGSSSDDFINFDPNNTNDDGPIVRSLASGPIDEINFLLSLNRLIAGTESAEHNIKSTSFDDPLTPSGTQAVVPSTQGSRRYVAPAKVDSRGVFASRSGKRIFELVPDGQSGDYRPSDLTLLSPNITGGASVVSFAVQRQPDTRIYAVLSDGTVAILTYEPDESVICWSRLSTGFVTGIVVLPGEEEDEVYFRVKRTIDGSVKFYLEKIALESEAVGGNVNKMVDSFQHLTGSISSITGASHLEGETVKVWADGRYRGEFTIASASAALGATYSDVVYGLGYTGTYKSSKLAYGAQGGSALTMRKKVNYLGLIMLNASIDGLEFGQDFTNMDKLQKIQGGKKYDEGHVFEEFDEPSQTLPGGWDSDSRLCLRIEAPYSCELAAGVISVETNEKV